MGGGPLDLAVLGHAANCLVGMIGFELVTAPIQLFANKQVPPGPGSLWPIDCMGRPMIPRPVREHAPSRLPLLGLLNH